MKPHHAERYDILYAPFWPAEKTAAELAFIESVLPEHGRVLDLGCGTGRHLVPLAATHTLTGVDEDEDMIIVTRRKLASAGRRARLLSGDILDEEWGGPFDLIIVMWNGFCEMARSAERFAQLAERLYGSLAPGGAVLIQQSNPATFTPEETFVYTVRSDAGDFRVTYKVVRQEGMRTEAEEVVEEIVDGEVVDAAVTLLSQRWYSPDEYRQGFSDAGFDVEVLTLAGGFVPDDPEFLVLARRPA